jgi:DNA-binding transcriptional LysR family regulator
MMTAREKSASLNFRRLKVFETVGRLSSVRGASEERHLSQPAISQTIAHLEDELGQVLFDRRAYGTYLNDLGVPNSALGAVAGRITNSQIRSLIAVVEHGSFTRAADAENVTRASLQRSARGLERGLGKTLFFRSIAGVLATPAAGEFARKLKLAIREIEAGAEEIKTATGGPNGRVLVGAMLMSGGMMLADVLDEFISSHPHADFGTASGNADDILQALRMGDVDFVIGLVSDPPAVGLVSEAVVETPYVVVARRSHPLAKQRSVTLDDLAAYDWVTGTPGSNRHQRLEKLFAKHPKPRARVETSSLTAIKLLVSRADRLTLLTSYELKHAGNPLVGVPFGQIGPAPKVGIIMRENWMPTPLQSQFLDLFRRRMQHALVWTPTIKRAS